MAGLIIILAAIAAAVLAAIAWLAAVVSGFSAPDWCLPTAAVVILAVLYLAERAVAWRTRA